MPRSLITLPHFLYSLCTCAVNSSGVLAIRSSPRSSNRFFWSGAASAFFRRSFSVAMMGRGVFAGAHRPCQVVNS